MVVLFAVLGASLLVCLMAWAIVTGFRIWRIDEPASVHSMVVRRESAKTGAFVRVGAREIREDQEYGEISRSLLSYELGPYGSTGIPPTWFDDIWIRRN